MVDILKHPLVASCYDLCLAIERIPAAGEEQTNASMLAGRLMEQINRFVGEMELDARRLDWMERKYVNVRQPLRYDSRSILWAAVGDEGEPSDLRKQIDAVIAGSSYPVVPDGPAYPPIADIQL